MNTEEFIDQAPEFSKGPATMKHYMQNTVMESVVISDVANFTPERAKDQGKDDAIYEDSETKAKMWSSQCLTAYDRALNKIAKIAEGIRERAEQKIRDSLGGGGDSQSWMKTLRKN